MFFGRPPTPGVPGESFFRAVARFVEGRGRAPIFREKGVCELHQNPQFAPFAPKRQVGADASSALRSGPCRALGTMGLTQRKRGRVQPEPLEQPSSVDEPGTSGFMATVRSLFRIKAGEDVYDLRNEEERERLIARLWTGEYDSATTSLAQWNPDLVDLFEAQELDGVAIPRTAGKSPTRWTGTLASLIRGRSKFQCPLSTALSSVVMELRGVPHLAWNTIRAFNSGAALAWKTTSELVDDAVAACPGPPYPTARGLSAAAFDNFEIATGTYAMQGDARAYEFAKMTNWVTLCPPASAVPGGQVTLRQMLGVHAVHAAVAASAPAHPTPAALQVLVESSVRI